MKVLRDSLQSGTIQEIKSALPRQSKVDRRRNQLGRMWKEEDLPIAWWLMLRRNTQRGLYFGGTSTYFPFSGRVPAPPLEWLQKIVAKPYPLSLPYTTFYLTSGADLSSGSWLCKGDKRTLAMSIPDSDKSSLVHRVLAAQYPDVGPTKPNPHSLVIANSTAPMMINKSIVLGLSDVE